MAIAPREDWSMPVKPIEFCPECGESVVAAVYVIDGGEVGLFWTCQQEIHDFSSLDVFIDWPFAENEIVSLLDLQALGFVVV